MLCPLIAHVQVIPRASYVRRKGASRTSRTACYESTSQPCGRPPPKESHNPHETGATDDATEEGERCEDKHLLTNMRFSSCWSISCRTASGGAASSAASLPLPRPPVWCRGASWMDVKESCARLSAQQDAVNTSAVNMGSTGQPARLAYKGSSEAQRAWKTVNNAKTGCTMFTGAWTTASVSGPV